MKRAWLAAMLALVVVASGSLVARAADTGSMGSGSKMSMAKGSGKTDALQEKLEAIERKVWDAFKSRDVKTATEAMAEDSWSVDMSGFSSTQQLGQMMEDYMVESYSLQDFKLIRLGKDAAILAYTVTANAKYQDRPIPSGPYYCSSTYVNRGAEWLVMFHQETLSQEAMSQEQHGRTGSATGQDTSIVKGRK